MSGSQFELTGKIEGVSFSYDDGSPLVTLRLNERRDALKMLDELRKVEKVSLKIGKFKPKRSLDANAYCWTLIGKIAEKTNVPKTEVYRDAIREIGGNYDVVCIKSEAVDTLRNAWERNGLGWLTEIQYSKLKGCTNVFLYYGSSTFDVSQMQRLIEILKQDCEALNIDTKSQAEIDSLLSSWGGR